MQNGAIRRKNIITNKSISIKPSLPEDFKETLKFNFITPYFISEHNSNTLYHAGNYLFKSTNKGDTWKVISDNLTIPNKFKNKTSYSAGAIAESKLEKGVLYYGSDKGLFWTSKNDGKSWINNSKNIVVSF